ncbi:hypothetical protein [Klebsiella pneumoniae]
MTDITELAQSMSIERIKQIALGGTPTVGEKERLAITALYFHHELKICTKAFQTAGLNQLAAEEALEAKDADAEWMRKRIAELAKARELKEIQRANWFQMAQKLGEDLDAAEKRIAELESRAVTVKPMRPGHITVGGEKIGIYMRDEVDEFLASLTAAGIKVEAE